MGDGVEYQAAGQRQEGQQHRAGGQHGRRQARHQARFEVGVDHRDRDTHGQRQQPADQARRTAAAARS
jgi:hypothetical protein